MLVHKGPAKVFDSEEDAIKAILANQIEKGDVAVIRYEGPKEDRECVKCSCNICGWNRLRCRCCLITDGRFSGATRACIGHVSQKLLTVEI